MRWNMPYTSEPKKETFLQYIWIFAIALAVAAGRFVFEEANFTPTLALALLSGYLLRGLGKAAVAVVLGMLLSDLLLPFDGLAMRGLVYASVLGSVGLGLFLPHFQGSSESQHGKAALIGEGPAWKRELRFGGAVLGSSAIGAVVFFLVTNFGVWSWSGMYAHTLDGVLQCYTNALPFFRNTLSSSLLFGAALLGLARAVQWLNRSKLASSAPALSLEK